MITSIIFNGFEQKIFVEIYINILVVILYKNMTQFDMLLSSKSLQFQMLESSNVPIVEKAGKKLVHRHCTFSIGRGPMYFMLYITKKRSKNHGRDK